MKTLLLYSENGCKLAQNFINNILRSGLNESRFPCSDVHRAKLITNNDTGRLQSRSNERNDETVLSIKTRTVTDSRNNNAVRKSVHWLNADYKRWTNALLFLSQRGIESNTYDVTLLKYLFPQISYSSSSKGMICLCSSRSWLRSYFGSFLRFFCLDSIISLPSSNVYSTVSPSVAFKSSSKALGNVATTDPPTLRNVKEAISFS